MASAFGLKLAAAPMIASDAASFSTATLNNSAYKVAWLTQAEDTNAITHLGVSISSVTSPPTMSMCLQGVNTSGQPDGTILGGGSPASGTFTPAAGWNWVALTNPYTPTLGQLFTVVMEYSSGTIGASNNSVVNTSTNGSSFLLNTADANFPHALQNLGSWTKNANQPFFGIRTASTRYGFPIASMAQLSTVTTSGHRTVMKFRVPSGFVSTYQVASMRAFFDPPSSGSDYTFGIWNAAGTALQSETRDIDFVPSALSRMLSCQFSSPATLSAGTWYYAGVQAAGVALALSYQTVDSSDDKLAYNRIEAGGATWDGSTWTDQDTWLPAVELTLGDITVASSGGIKTQLGMNGGFNG